MKVEGPIVGTFLNRVGDGHSQEKRRLNCKSRVIGTRDKGQLNCKAGIMGTRIRAKTQGDGWALRIKTS